ncbi:MAG: pyridoxamine 5'-phosphate oxidase family protein, partial [Bacteroidota bacterium]|nr:pyridoxamine 5'-phosphate oxidase family protein [Bacteroidota bacterium]
LPMNFGYQDDEIILHSAQEGRLISVLKKNPKVCVTFCHGEELVWQNEHVACSYRVKSTSVVAEGTIRFVDDFDEKVKYLHLTMKQYTSATFQFGAPAVRNVNIMVVKVDNITAKEFGVDPNSPKFR